MPDFRHPFSPPPPPPAGVLWLAFAIVGATAWGTAILLSELLWHVETAVRGAL